MPNYFVLDSKGNKRGPFSVQQLQALVAKGNVRRQTLVVSDKRYAFVFAYMRLSIFVFISVQRFPFEKLHHEKIAKLSAVFETIDRTD